MKLNELNPCELLTLTTMISQKLFNCFELCEIPTLKLVLNNICNQLTLLEVQLKTNEHCPDDYD